MKVTKVAPVFPIQKARIHDKYTENSYFSGIKPEKTFKSVLGKELQLQTKIDVKV